ncbi:transcriptional regulator KorA [Acidovorax sp. SUPP1855]|uniref:hypothetical protein n=1 Tax=Acidovorax sp. SUPP1855 TaxID=431774 RepID=UPI0023DE4E8E|nr:hypothetical protein [Acidovorax sp. SUPP1855]GKS87137.1 transcriptional regulator KorA [Acidovorax sp. SUPP1855]
MTAEAFEALTKLLRITAPASKEAARLVLVDGMAPGAAAKQTGLTPAGVSNVLSSARKGAELAKLVVAGL